MSEELQAQVEKINSRMYKRRIDQYSDAFQDWRIISPRRDNRPPRTIIGELLQKGYKVTSGYYTTGVRGYHEHFILWKEKGNIKNLRSNE